MTYTYDELLDCEYEVEVEGDDNRLYTFYAELEWPGEYDDEQWEDLPDEIEILEDPTFDIIAVLDDEGNDVEVPFSLIKRAKEVMSNIYWNKIFEV